MEERAPSVLRQSSRKGRIWVLWPPQAEGTGTFISLLLEWTEHRADVECLDGEWARKGLTLQPKRKGSQEEEGVRNSVKAFYIRSLLIRKPQGPYTSSQQPLGWKNSALRAIQGCLGDWRMLPGGLKDYGPLGIWRISLISPWLRLSPSALAQMLMGDSCPGTEGQKSAGLYLVVFLL